MEKYARLVFEEEIPEGATSEEIVRKMKKCIENYAKDGVSMREGDV